MTLTKIKKFYPDAIVPLYATDLSAGFDLYAHNVVRRYCYKVLPHSNEDTYIINPGGSAMIGTGIGIQAPGHEVQIRPRSGLAVKHGITVLNTPGTIDEDFTNEVCVLLINHSDKPFVFAKEDRIAQGVLAPVSRADFVVVDELVQSNRNGGFGSTGK